MNYDITDNYGMTDDYSFLNKVIDYTLEHENAEGSVFSLVFVDEKTIQDINREYRNIDSITDVISFAFEDNYKLNSNIRVLGDIYICIPKMNSQAKEYGHTKEYELAFLTVHGILHLLGYDHVKNKEEEKIMFELQDKIIEELGII